MKVARKSLVLVLLIGVLIASCAPQVAGEPTVDINASLTAGVGTVIANFFETQTALAPPASETPSITPLPLETNTALSLPTVGVVASPTPYILYLSPTPTGTYYTATPNPSSLAYGCYNLAFLADVSVPSGTVMRPGQAFTKEWKVANTGTCEWPWAYRVVNVSGNAMNGGPTHPNQAIAAGRWTTLRVAMEAPSQPGNYTGYWQMSDDTGHKFGSILGVSIVVAEPTRTPQPATPTSTSTNMPPPALTIASISPNSAKVGEAVTMTITGTGFASGATVSFEGGTGTAPAVSAITVDNATSITITVAVDAAATAGQVWNVRVTSSGNNVILNAAFTVTQ